MNTGEIASCKWMNVSNKTSIVYYIEFSVHALSTGIC